MAASLREELANGLQRHIRGERKPGLPVEGTTLREYKAELTQIRTKYSSPPYCFSAEALDASEKAVDDDLFAWSRRTVKECVEQLDRTEPEVLFGAFATLTNELFQPLFNKLSYDASKYFEMCGGVPKLMALIRLYYDRHEATHSREDEIMCIGATTTMCGFGNDEEQIAASAEAGFLALVVDMLQSSSSVPIKGKCLESICDYTDNSEWQIYVAKAGAFDPLLNIVTTGQIPIDEADSAVASLVCCAVNPRVVDFLLDVEAPEKLALFSKDVHDVYKSECTHGSYIFHGVEIVKAVPTHISYLCCVAIAQIIRQLNQRRWKEQLVELRKKRQTNQSVRHWYQLASVSKSDKGVLQCIRKFLTSCTPDEVRFADDRRYSWPVLTPFSSLLFCSYLEGREMGAFALANLCQGGENRDVIRSEEGASLGALQLATWSSMAPHKSTETDATKVREHCKKSLELASRDGLDPPRLEDICLYFVSSHFRCCFSGQSSILPLNLLKKVSPFCHKYSC